MKIIRYSAASLLILSGVMYVYFTLKNPTDTNASIALIFGIVYLILGLLLIMNLNIAIWLGFIVPIIPLLSSPFMVDIKTLNRFEICILLIDLAVVVCCLILLLKNRQHK